MSDRLESILFLSQVGRLCPLLGGTGPATMVLVSLLNVYYCVIVGWAIFYLIVSLATLPSLPWDTCGKMILTTSSSSGSLQRAGGTLNTALTSTKQLLTISLIMMWTSSRPLLWRSTGSRLMLMLTQYSIVINGRARV